MPPATRRARVLVGWLIGAGFLAALVWTTFAHSSVECEVCVDFGGDSLCRSVAAATADEAARQAQSTVCAILSSGVTEGLQCDRTPPRSLRCSEP